MRHLLIVVWLTVVWVTLWEVVSWANVLGGLIVAGLVVAMLPPRAGQPRGRFRPLAAIRLVVYFNWELIAASALMAWEVVTPRNRIRAAVVPVGLTTGVSGVLTAVANMVSLTPGTVTLDIDEDTRTLFIHVLHFKSLEETRRSVRRLEELTLAAFPQAAEGHDTMVEPT